MQEINLLNENATPQENYPFKWALPTFYILDKNLKIIDQSQEPPKEWGKAKYIYPRRKSKQIVPEEVYVTLLSIFLEKFAEEGLSFINRSHWSTWGGADLTAVDNLWRIHLFEAKNNKCNLKELGQLEAYFDATSFENVKGYISKNLSSPPFSEDIFKALMFGLYSGTTTSRIKKETISKKLEIKIKHKDWKKHDQKAELIAKHLMSSILKLWDFSVSKDEISDIANGFYNLLKSYRDKIIHKLEEGVALKWLKPQRKTVLWLVGTDFHNDVIKKVMRLRGNRLDYRLLKMEVRFTRGMNEFLVKIQKEDFPQRDKINMDVSKWFNSNPGNYKTNIQYYLDHSPSGRTKPDLGHCLRKPKVEIFDENFKLIKWR